jgi:integrase
MSAPLLHCAPPQHRDRLFIVKRLSSGARHGDGIGLIDVWTLRSAIRRFRRRANARIEAWNAAHPDRPPRPALPDFAPVFFRGSVATEHYKASGGDILVAQAVLNHADAVTTETYIKGPDTRRLQHETIARLPLVSG